LNKSLDLNEDFEINQKEGGRSLENHIEVNDDNLQEILARKSIDSGIRVNGWFSSRYVFENEEIISYYKKCIVPKKIDNPSDLFVHVRLGDINKKFNLPYEYYKNQISKIDYNDCFLTSDSISHPIVKDLQKRFKNIQLFTGWSPSFTIRYGANCNKLVLSSGTFSLCMALFNRGTPNVYCIDNYSMEKNANFLFEKVNKIFADGIRRAFIPGGIVERLLGGENFHEARREVVELVGLVDMAVEGLAIELSEDVNSAQAGVQAVADRDIDEPVFSAERHGRLRAFLGQGKEACAGTAAHDDCQGSGLE
jgi:hypothetical protein